MPTINVTGPNPYKVVIDHGLDETIARTAAAAPGATQVALIYQQHLSTLRTPSPMPCLLRAWRRP